MNRVEEIDSKIRSIRDYLALRGAKGLYLEQAENFAWLTGGMKNYVTLNNVQTECAILVTPESAYVVSPHSELQRLDAQLPAGVLEIVVHDWDVGPAEVVAETVGSDCFLSDSERATADYLRDQRVVLNENEQHRLGKLGGLTAKVLEEGLRGARPEMSEQELAALIVYELMSQGVEPVLVIVSGEASFRSHHNISGEGKIGAICMGIVCAKLKGLVVSMTRMISFQDDQRLIEQMELNTAIDAAVINATRHSETLGEAFETLVSFYEDSDLTEEWRKLHQGGIVGYRLKEYFASRRSRVTLRDGMAFAWNITISGTKSEDTFLLRDGRMHWITNWEGSEWPVFKHEIDGEIYSRPALLTLNKGA
jgi:Xaa-Pro aminopeptidase